MALGFYASTSVFPVGIIPKVPHTKINVALTGRRKQENPGDFPESTVF